MKLILIHLLAWLQLIVPTLVEVIDDKRNDKNKSHDVVIRTVLILVCGSLNAWWLYLQLDRPLIEQMVKASLLSAAIFFFSFDYFMAAVYNKPATYLGTTAKWDGWIRRIHPLVMFIIKYVVLTLATINYFI